MDNDALFTISLQSISYDTLMQILFRVMSFALNGLALRYINKEVLGLINVRLMLLHATIVFVSKEAFRRACISNSKDYKWPRVINLTWLTVPTSTICSYVFCMIWLGYWDLLQLPQEHYRHDYELAVKAFGVSCVIESLAEPVYIFSQAFLYVRLRLLVDFLVVLMRACILVASVIYFPDYTLRATAYGQLTISTVFVIFYWIYFHLEFRKKAKLLKNQESYKTHALTDLPISSIGELFPRNILSYQPFFDGKLAKIAMLFFIQGVFKQILTDGERYVMTGLSTLTIAEQGTYDIVNNLGSLAARFVFRPIEQNSYTYFTRKLSRDKPLKEHPLKDIKELSLGLRMLLRAVALIGLGILSFGLSYSHLLLLVYGGSTLVDGPGPLLMKAHCVATLLMAINGVTEAYAIAAMSSKQLKWHNILMILFSCSFLFLSWLLSYVFGSVGFIIANCCNMGLRIMHSLWFINRHFKDVPEKPLSYLLPDKTELLALGTALVVTWYSECYIYPCSVSQHMALGVAVGIMVLRVIVYTEVGSWKQLYCIMARTFSMKM